MTKKISVWAFNKFTRFDAITAAFGLKTQRAEPSYCGKDAVKMVNTDHDLKLDLVSFLETLKTQVTAGEFQPLHNAIYKKNGEMRRLEGKEVKHAFDDFLVVIKF